MANLLIPIIILVPITVVTAVAAPLPVANDDMSALLAFLSNVSADHGAPLADWGRSLVFCNWMGVVCGHPPEANGELNVTQLGAIPAIIGLLQKLYFLDLSSNCLSDAIPETLFYNCTSLQYIDLANNSLAGDIPYSTECRLPSLRYLLLWSNDLSDPIPPALSNSSMIKWIDFESNYLASELKLVGNNLDGKLSPFVGELSLGFHQIHLEDNAITGSIPPNIFGLVNLTYLNLSNNLLNGSIPPVISRMRRLYLSNNILTIKIPWSIGKMPHLGLVDLSGNRLTGTILDTFSSLTQLRRVMLHHNQLSGAIPASLGDCLNLEILDLSYNGLHGWIPLYVERLSINVTPDVERL
ncbi:hypothetical protein GUJ93_ZPchr0006g42444 [Zizania palustris]|uniref:non-specific serine/threonine protein kinase n=1 Tax=Zizania palustris TaxID=103762 RepID=A0A8J5SIM5_ZIZPA|nr:hypothetical protein GUJ93_ZPchr0006g42444 [Zizania palustris]